MRLLTNRATSTLLYFGSGRIFHARLAHVGDHADDGGIVAGDHRHTPERILSRPKAFRRGFIQHHNVLRFGQIGPAHVAARAQMHAHCLEISGRHDVNERVGIIFRPVIHSLGRQTPTSVALERQHVGNAGGLDPRNCFHAAEDFFQNHGALVFGHDMERAVHNVEILEKCAMAYLLAICTEKKISKIPLAVREIAFAKLRKDQKKTEQGEEVKSGE